MTHYEQEGYAVHWINDGDCYYIELRGEVDLAFRIDIPRSVYSPAHYVESIVDHVIGYLPDLEAVEEAFEGGLITIL